jgi:ABC-type multidrug transport system fused ATPase/permease subunit
MIELFQLFMGKYYREHKLSILFLVIVSLLFIISESIITPYFISRIINNLNNYQEYLVYLIILLCIVSALFYFKKKYECSLFSDFITVPRERLFSSIIDRYSENYKSLKMGTTTSKINNITNEFRNFFQFMIVDIFPNIVVLILISGVLLYLNVNVGLISIAGIIFMFIAIIYFKNNIYKIKHDGENYYYKVNNNLIDIYESLMNTYLNNSEKQEKEKIIKDQKMYNYYISERYKKENYLGYILYAITVLVFILCLFYVLTFIPNNKKTLIILFLIYFMASSLIITKNIPFILQIYGAIIFNIHFVKDLLYDTVYKNTMNVKIGKIEFINVNFSYKKNNLILKDINLKIPNKMKIAITGRSGSGKSTLSKLLLKFYPYQGKILLDGKDIQTINTSYLRSKILYCNQRTSLYDRPVIENMKYGSNATNDEILTLLKDYDLLEIFNGLKNGIYSDSGVQGSELSLGMQKIVIIIRTILKVSDAVVVIFDEPLAGLDAGTRKKVIKLILHYCSKKTLIVITHDKEILPYMDKTIDLNSINKK